MTAIANDCWDIAFLGSCVLILR